MPSHSHQHCPHCGHDNQYDCNCTYQGTNWTACAHCGRSPDDVRATVNLPSPLAVSDADQPGTFVEMVDLQPNGFIEGRVVALVPVAAHQWQAMVRKGSESKFEQMEKEVAEYQQLAANATQAREAAERNAKTLTDEMQGYIRDRDSAKSKVAVAERSVRVSESKTAQLRRQLKAVREVIGSAHFKEIMQDNELSEDIG